MTISAEYFHPILDSIRDNLEYFFKLSEYITDFGKSNFIATVQLFRSDVYRSLAIVSSKEGWKFPEVGKDANIIGVYHPLLARLKQDVVSNDLKLENKKGVLITGPNMAGKSTFLLSVAISQILFQMGCGVPVKPNSQFEIFNEIRFLISEQDESKGDDDHNRQFQSEISQLNQGLVYILSDSNCPLMTSTVDKIVYLFL